MFSRTVVASGCREPESLKAGAPAGSRGRQGPAATRLGTAAAVGATVAGVGFGCASQKAIAPGAQPVEATPRIEQPLSQQAQSQALAAMQRDDSATPVALLGARHDLSLAAKREASCRCLSAALFSDPNDPGLQWEEAPPRIATGNQWVIALSSEGVPCATQPGEGLGASYQGYRVDGADVIVSVESLAQGRPRMSGAIIPAPTGGGSVYVESAQSLYGKPISGGAKRCRLKLPPEAEGNARP